MNNTLPTVSICICSYNQVLYLEDAVRSAAKQSYFPQEIIVSDDCSTDGSTILLERLSKEIPTLKVHYQSHNTGIARNTDYCLRQANGDFVIRLDSDDVLLPAFVETLLKTFIQYPTAGYAHAAVQEIDEKGNFLNIRRLYRSCVFQSDDQAFKKSVKGYRVAANIIMFRRDALVAVDYMNGRPNFGEDYHLTSDLSNVGFGNIYLDQILSHYRVWTDLGRIRQKRKLNEIIGIRRVFEDVLEPGFRSRGWDLGILDRRRSAFACHHANCLGWNFYGDEEKQEIIVELRKLSPTAKVKIYCLVYLKGYGWLADVPSEAITRLRSALKYSILKLLASRSSTSI
jgi:glycosyltransferase involved in cell wall biosynthesis